MINVQFKRFIIASLLAVATLIIPDMAAAGALTGIGTALCGLVTFMQTTPVKAAATASIVFLGVAAFFGKLNWGLAVAIALGIMFMFGAVPIVDWIATKSGGAAVACA